MENISDYCAIKRGEEKHVTVVFSALNTEKGRFLGVKTFSSENGHTIFLNCPRNEWYLNGIPGLGRDWREASLALHELCIEIAGSEYSATYYGGSMGGYGALLYGSTNNAKLIVATGVEFELGLPLGNAVLHITPPASNPIYEQINQSNSECVVMFGGMSIADLYCAKMALENTQPSKLEVYIVEGAGHSIPGLIEQRFGLLQLLQNMRLGNRPHVLGSRVSVKDLEMVSEVYKLALKNHTAAPNDIVEKVIFEGAPRDLSVLACYYAGERLREAGAIRESLGSFQRGIKLNEENFLCHLGIARTLQKQGRIADAIEHLRSSVSLMDPPTWQVDYNAFIFLSKLLIQKGEQEEAISHLRKLLHYRPQNKIALEMINSLGSSDGMA
jgi:tetratricopeptide (TPR) repeat protein